MGSIYARFVQVVLGLTALLFLVSLLNFIPAVGGNASLQLGIHYYSAVLLGLSALVVLPMVVVRHPHPEIWLSATTGAIAGILGLTDGLDALAVMGLVVIGVVIGFALLGVIGGASARVARDRGWHWPIWAGTGLSAVFLLVRVACGLVCLGFGLTSLYFAIMFVREGDLGSFFLLLLTGGFFSLVGIILLIPLIRLFKKTGAGNNPDENQPSEGER